MMKNEHGGATAHLLSRLGSIFLGLTLVAGCWLVGCGDEKTESGWREVESGVYLPLRGVWARSADRAWAVGSVENGEVGMILSWDGVAWSTDVDTEDRRFSAIRGSGDDVWVVGSTRPYNLDNEGLAYRLVSQGAWERLPCGDDSLWGVAVHSTSAAIGVGYFEHISWWNGSFWDRREILLEEENSYYAAWFSSRSDIWLVGSDGAIVRGDGTHWEAVESPTSNSLLAIWGKGPDEVWAVGAEGTVIEWDGDSWSIEDAGAGDRALRGVWGVSAGDVWVVGESGTILHRSPAGVWTEEAVGTTNVDLHDVWGTSAADIWAVGEKGVILHFEP
jgi:hypothetical protein